MELRLLLDEDTERRLAEYLENGGHDVERVVDVGDLGPGAKDVEVREYARQTDRILVTHDDDHDSVSPTEHAGVFYCPNQRLSSFDVYRIIDAITSSYPSVDSMQPVVYLTESWL